MTLLFMSRTFEHYSPVQSVLLPFNFLGLANYYYFFFLRKTFVLIYFISHFNFIPTAGPIISGQI